MILATMASIVTISSFKSTLIKSPFEDGEVEISREFKLKF